MDLVLGVTKLHGSRAASSVFSRWRRGSSHRGLQPLRATDRRRGPLDVMATRLTPNSPCPRRQATQSGRLTPGTHWAPRAGRGAGQGWCRNWRPGFATASAMGVRRRCVSVPLRCDGVYGKPAHRLKGKTPPLRGRRNTRDHPPNLWITLWAIPGAKPQNRMTAEHAWKLPAKCALAKTRRFFQPELAGSAESSE